MVRPHRTTQSCAVRYRAEAPHQKTNRIWPPILAFLLLATGILFSSGEALAQEFRGTISGTVTDSSGAVIPGAQVTAREVRTGTVAHTTTDAAGQYTIPFLLPGQYELTVSATGFQKLVHSNVPLSAQDHLVVPLQLKIGSVAQTVTVSGAPPLLDTANASVGQVIETSSVENMPINGRTPTTLTELAPGVITTAPPQLIHPFDNNAGNQWSIGGTPNQVSEVLLDGSPDETLLGALAYAPTEDSVAQVSVRPFDTDASFGHTIGGVINQITKSGTNGFHGSAYEFYQVNSFDANYYFNNRSNIPVPGFHFNQYGVSVGGPILKNKLFFFFAWEGLRDINPANATLTVPTAAEKAGDFSQTLAAGCSSGGYTVNGSGMAICKSNGQPDPNQLFNPFTATTSGKNIVRQPIPNNQLASTGHAFSPVALDYLKLYPQPNVTGNPDGSDNYISNAPSTDNYDNEFGRLDYNFSARDHIFMDARHNNRYQLKNDYFGNGTTGTTLYRENLGATVDNIFTINPTTILDTRVNWTWFNEVHGTPGQKYSPSSVGFPSYMDTAGGLKQLPFIGFNGSCGSHTSYQCFGDTGSALDPTTSYQLFTDVVKELGRHSLKVGFDGRQYRISIQNFGDSAGNFTEGTSWVTSGTTGAAQTFGGDLAEFMFGLANSGTYSTNLRSNYHQYYLGAFVQDDWKVSDRLTLNLGVRYDFDTPFREKQGRTVDGFDPGASIAYTKQPSFGGATASSNGETFSVASINTRGGLTFPNRNNGAVYETNNGFISPRFGFSYAVTPKTVARGGFGVFVQPETLTSLNSTGNYSSAAISNSEGFSSSTSFVPSNDSFQTVANTLNNPFPTGFTPPAGASMGASTNLGQSISFLAPVQHDPYSERWDIGVQRSLTNNSMIQVLYVGNHALHLPVQQQDLNATEIQYLSRSPFRDQARASAYGQKVNNPFKGTLPSVSGVPNSTGVNTGSTVSFSSLLVPYPQFGTSHVYIQNQTIGQSWYNSGIIAYQHRSAHGFTLTGNYSFSKLIEQDTFLNDEDTMLTRRISPYDHVHHFTVGGSYELPFGKNKSWNFGGNKLWDEVAGGWVINGVYQFQTGSPVVFTSDIPLQPGTTLRQIANHARNTAPVGSPTPALNRAAFVTGNSTSCPSGGSCDGSTYLNGQYTFHYRTLPQTLSWVRQDGFNNLDASLLKNFHFTERAYLQLRFEAFNALNHPVFDTPNVSSATSSNFGYITGTAKNSQPRQIQLGGRIVF